MIPISELVTIGSQDNADAATVIVADMSVDGFAIDLECNSKLPSYAVRSGWKLAGIGVTRVALIGPDNVVYKVAKTKYDEPENRREWENRFRITFDSDLYRIADCNMWITDMGPVVAMEYVKEELTLWDDRKYDHRFDIEKAAGLYDVGAQNIRFSDGVYVVIDYSR